MEALAVLGNCLEDVHAMQLIQQTGGLKKLLSFVGDSAVPDIQKNAAKAIAKAAYDCMWLFKNLCMWICLWSKFSSRMRLSYLVEDSTCAEENTAKKELQLAIRAQLGNTYIWIF